MANQLAKHGAIPLPLLWAALALLFPCSGHAALAPPKEDAADRREAENAPQDSAGQGALPVQGIWMLPNLRLGGLLQYSMRRDTSDAQSTMQKAEDARLTARLNGFLWQPWVAQYTCTANVSVSHTQRDGTAGSSSGQSLSTTGAAQLNLLPKSMYPFEAHYSRYDSRFSSDLSVPTSQTGQSFGFSQNFNRQSLSAMAGWDRNTQNGGRDQQDTLRMNASAGQERSRVQVITNVGRNIHEEVGLTQNARQNNASVMHSLMPIDTVSMQNMASLSQSSFRLQQAEGASRVQQLSSVAFWRPDETEMTVSGGARLLTLESDSSSTIGGLTSKTQNRAQNANFNVGLNYDAIKFTRISVGGNLNLNQTDGVRSSDTNQNAGISYQPDSIDLGNFRYNWSTSANAGRATGEQASHDLGWQIGHGLNRRIMLSPASSIGLDGNQSITIASRSATGLNGNNLSENRKFLTHGASASWNLAGESTSVSTQLSANDGRSLGGDQEFFQVINFQASSNMPTSKTSSWSGNLTVQAVRQGVAATSGTGLGPQDSSKNTGFVTNSSGSVSYQQQRVFGIRRLRLVSDLRLNSQALLPLLGGPRDQEASAWESRFDYVLGRMQFRLNFLMSKMVTPATNVDPVTGAGVGSRTSHVAKSISFSMSRAIGDM